VSAQPRVSTASMTLRSASQPAAAGAVPQPPEPQPDPLVPVADPSGKGSRGPQLTSAARTLMARQVYDHLRESDRQLALAGRPQDISFKRYSTRSDATRSPLALAWTEVQKHMPELEGKKFSSVRGSMYRWFVRHYTHGQSVLCRNKPRAKSEVSEALLTPFRDVLTRTTWLDSCQRHRRYLSLAQYHKALVAAPNRGRKLAKFTQDWKATGVRSLLTLERLVAQNFNLRRRMERFKRPRRKDLARMCAKVMLGHEPVREHFTHYKKTNNQKIVTVKRHTDAYTEYLESIVPPPPDACAASTSAATRQQHTGRTANFQGVQYRYDKLHLEPGRWDMVCNIDGFTVELRRQADSLRNRVYIEPNELLGVMEDEMLDVNVGVLEKQYYFVVMVPGYGIRAAVAMRSGTRLRDNSCDGSGLLFWYDRLTEFGLPGGILLESRLRDKAANYKVSLCCLSIARMLAKLADPGVIRTRGTPRFASSAVFSQSLDRVSLSAAAFLWYFATIGCWWMCESTSMAKSLCRPHVDQVMTSMSTRSLCGLPAIASCHSTTIM